MLSDTGTKLTSNKILAWADERCIAWRYISRAAGTGSRILGLVDMRNPEEVPCIQPIRQRWLS